MNNWLTNLINNNLPWFLEMCAVKCYQPSSLNLLIISNLPQSSIIETVDQLSLFHPFNCGAQLLIQLVNYHYFIHSIVELNYWYSLSIIIVFICSITKFNYLNGWSIIIISPFNHGTQLLTQLVNYHYISLLKL